MWCLQFQYVQRHMVRTVALTSQVVSRTSQWAAAAIATAGVVVLVNGLMMECVISGEGRLFQLEPSNKIIWTGWLLHLPVEAGKVAQCSSHHSHQLQVNI